jgi:hypothetical protein
MGMWSSFVADMRSTQLDELESRMADNHDRIVAAATEEIMSIYKYTFINNDDAVQDFDTLDKTEAINYATEHGLAIVEEKYTFDDAELVGQWDFREKTEAGG